MSAAAPRGPVPFAGGAGGRIAAAGTPAAGSRNAER